MPLSWKMRLGIWLQRFEFLHPLLLKFDGFGKNNTNIYVNRLSGILVVKDD